MAVYNNDISLFTVVLGRDWRDERCWWCQSTLEKVEEVFAHGLLHPVHKECYEEYVERVRLLPSTCAICLLPIDARASIRTDLGDLTKEMELLKQNLKAVVIGSSLMASLHLGQMLIQNTGNPSLAIYLPPLFTQAGEKVSGPIAGYLRKAIQIGVPIEERETHALRMNGVFIDRIQMLFAFVAIVTVGATMFDPLLAPQRLQLLQNITFSWIFSNLSTATELSKLSTATALKITVTKMVILLVIGTYIFCPDQDQLAI